MKDTLFQPIVLCTRSGIDGKTAGNNFATTTGDRSFQVTGFQIRCDSANAANGDGNYRIISGSGNHAVANPSSLTSAGQSKSNMSDASGEITITNNSVIPSNTDVYFAVNTADTGTAISFSMEILGYYI